jgi:acyl-CoA synthetase (AMP-forming)/AMP-acid ligase II
MGAKPTTHQHQHSHSHGTPHQHEKDKLPHTQRPSVVHMISRCKQQNPTGVATVYKDRTRTWEQVEKRIACLASALKNQLKLTPGGRVALVAFNSDRYFEIFFAVSWAGGIVVPMNIRLAPPEMIEQFNDCAVEIILVDENFSSIVQSVEKNVKSIRHVVYCGDAPQNAIKLEYETLVSTNQPLSDSDNVRGGYDTFGLFYTGGTTGKSKGVELTHSNIFINALGHVALLQYTPNSRYLHSAPMFHLADGASTFGITMACGSHVFISRFVPEDMLEAIEKHKVTCGMAVPAMVAMLLQSKAATTRDCSSLESLMYGASPMPLAILEPALKLFPRCKFRAGYGMSETSPAISTLAPEFHDPKKGKISSVGQPVPWVEAKIVDKNDKEVPRGTVGEIITRGPHVMKGYWNMPEKTREALRGGWMHTEDGGYMDKDGFIFIVDRLKDMIITGGENVYSAEVENAVASFPNVAMCAAVGYPDPKYVEIVTAVVVLKDPSQPFDEKKLIEHCREKIANYKVPRKVVVMKELPMSGAGKILKTKIREMLGTDAIGRVTGSSKL